MIYDPTELLKRISPKSKVKKLLSRGANLKRTALSFIDSVDFINKKRVTEVALKTVKQYKKRLESEAIDKKDIIKNPKQLIQRVQNEVVFQVSTLIREKHSGKTYVWLPSSANEPDPEHQLNYGKRFTIGVGEMPGERYGCQCGMDIDIDENLNL